MSPLKEQIDNAQQALDLTFTNVQNEDWLGALRTLDAALKCMQEAAPPLVRNALNGGATKKAIAQALDVPPSTFRGMQRSAS